MSSSNLSLAVFTSVSKNFLHPRREIGPQYEGEKGYYYPWGVFLQEDDRRDGRWASGPAWVSSEWQATEAGAVQILPYGLDGHQVKDVVGSMQLQRIVLLTDRIEVSPSCSNGWRPCLVGPGWCDRIDLGFLDGLPAFANSAPLRSCSGLAQADSITRPK